MKTADISFLNNKIILTGELHFSNVMAIYKKSLSHLSASPVLEFDFSAVKNSDSAGLALIIEWIKFAKATQKEIKIYSISKEILQLARAAGLEKIFTATIPA